MREETRRLALVRKQTMIARLGRHTAMRALAEALDDESRTAALARRSAALLHAASHRAADSATGAALASRVGFAAGLGKIAQDAAAATGDAARQTQWQSEALAAAEARAKRLGELEDAAVRALEQAQQQRRDPATPKLARKLHTNPAPPSADTGKG